MARKRCLLHRLLIVLLPDDIRQTGEVLVARLQAEGRDQGHHVRGRCQLLLMVHGYAGQEHRAPDRSLPRGLALHFHVAPILETFPGCGGRIWEQGECASWEPSDWCWEREL